MLSAYMQIGILFLLFVPASTSKLRSRLDNASSLEVGHMALEGVLSNITIGFLQATETSATVNERIAQEIQRELWMNGDAGPQVNKMILAVINVLGLGLFGIDRCYMGQVGLGIVKGMTAGGFLIWSFIDYFIIF